MPHQVESAEDAALVLARALLAHLESLANIQYLLQKKLADRDDVAPLLAQSEQSLQSMITATSGIINKAPTSLVRQK